MILVLWKGLPRVKTSLENKKRMRLKGDNVSNMTMTVIRNRKEGRILVTIFLWSMIIQSLIFLLYRLNT